MHIPVMPTEVTKYWVSLDRFSNIREGIYIDATFGEGGHSRIILDKLPENTIVIGIDLDKQRAIDGKEKFKKWIKEKRLWLINENFKNIKSVIHAFKTKVGITDLSVRGVLFDFGMCTTHLEENRGFSFRELEAPLDMRFDRENNKLTAEEILNSWKEEEIARIIWELGDEPRSRRIARAIIEFRKTHGAFKSVGDLVELLRKNVGNVSRGKKIHFATRTFQAFRMAVNHERENIIIGLKGALDILSKEGRIVTISFHSGEDRVVKNFFRYESKDCVCPPNFPICRCRHKKSLSVITKKPLTPSQKEKNLNPNSRSAKVRVAEKK